MFIAYTVSKQLSFTHTSRQILMVGAAYAASQQSVELTRIHKYQ